MNQSVKSDEELIALLERTMHKVSECAPDMEFPATVGNQRWMASAAAATVLVVGVGAAGLALNARHDASNPLSPGAQTAMSSIDGGSSASTTTSIVTTTGTPRPVDARDDAWRAAVYQEMESFGTCATTDYGVGSGPQFSAKTICTHFLGDQPVDGNLVFVLEALPDTIDTSSLGWQQRKAGFDTPGVSVGTDALMFVETSNGVARRVAIVTPKHMILVAAELIDDQYVPSGDHDLTVAAQDLNKVADSILEKAAGAAGDGHCVLASYIVLEGDTPAGVAQTFDVTVEALKAANVTNPSFDAFPVGSTIFIPSKTPFVCSTPTPTGGPHDTTPSNG